MEGPLADEVRTRLLAWFDAGHRDLPWRRTMDPYRILVSEYLLQRTRVVSGTPYYERFLARFPDVAALASASEEDVLRAWEGLGFYRRARNLHAAAKAIVRDHGGRIPRHAATLAALPGIGPYTAGAVASIAFGEAVPAVDGNVTRVLSRVYRIEADVTAPAGKRTIDGRARGLVPSDRPGAFNQALMELGATVCTRRQPTCTSCPLGDLCLARRAGVQESLPRSRAPRRPVAVEVAFAYVRERGRTLLVRRPESDLLGGFWALPGGEIPAGKPHAAALRGLVAAQTGLDVEVGDEVARVAHTFSHRRWLGSVVQCAADGVPRSTGDVRWVRDADLAALPLVPADRRLLQEIGSRHSLESFDESPGAAASRRRMKP